LFNLVVHHEDSGTCVEFGSTHDGLSVGVEHGSFQTFPVLCGQRLRFREDSGRGGQGRRLLRYETSGAQQSIPHSEESVGLAIVSSRDCLSETRFQRLDRLAFLSTC
jgi:hypothetical protein